MKLFSFTFDSSPVVLEVLSSNTFYDLVDVAFRVCDPREGEDAQDHLWHIKILPDHPDDDLGDGGFGAMEGTYKYHPYEEAVGGRCANEPLGSKLKMGTKLKLTYDYGSTSEHIFTVVDIETVQQPSMASGLYPRRKPEAPGTTTSFATSLVNLNDEYPALNRWAFSKGLVEMNLFQAGKKQKFGFLERWGARMIFLPDKAESLNHYFECLEKGAAVPASGMYNWHSVVVLPAGSRKTDKYSKYLEGGFCDCEIVATKTYQTDLSNIFPKTAALGGFRKDKRVKKGWIRYKDETLMVVQGSGGCSSCPNAPGGTAYDGIGFHASGIECYLFRIQKEFNSLHDMLCEVEGLLETL